MLDLQCESFKLHRKLKIIKIIFRRKIGAGFYYCWKAFNEYDFIIYGPKL